MKRVLTVLFFGCTLLVYAQDEIRVTTSYYDKDGVFKKERDGSYYYKIDSSTKDKHGSYSYYTSNDQLRYREPFHDDKGERHTEMFYENGQKMWEGTSSSSTLLGTFTMWYSDGKKLAVIEYPKEKPLPDTERKFQVMQYWDSLGTQLVTNGEGSGDFKFPDKLENGSGKFVGGFKHGKWTGKAKVTEYNFEESYDRGVLLNGFSMIDGKRKNYIKIEEPSQFPGGVSAMFSYIGRTMTYPKSARRRGIEGTVFVEFVVEKDGAVKDVKVIKGISADCDEESIRTVSSFPKWVPGLHRGAPVKVRFVLPLKFVLGD